MNDSPLLRQPVRTIALGVLLGGSLVGLIGFAAMILVGGIASLIG